MEGYIKSNFLENYNENSKKAILVVNFGTTHFDTREETIEVLIKEVKEKFTNFEIRECYTSRIILKKLREKNIFIDNPVEAMERLKNEGYTHVIIISSNVIDGIEYKALVKNIEHFNGDFQELRIAPPLLNTNTSFLKVAKTLNGYFGNPSEKEAYLFVGHGTLDSSDSAYPCMDYIFKYLGYSYYVGTIEGFPSIDEIKEILAKDGIKKVTLIPFMIVAGEHAKNDIANDWKEELESSGFDVNLNLTSLGAIKEIRDIFIENGELLLNYKKEDILEKKLFYSR